MITKEQLISTFHRIEDLKEVRKEKWAVWHTFKAIEDDEDKTMTKDQTKEMSTTFKTINSLNYEIRGLERTFKEQSEEFILQVVGG